MSCIRIQRVSVRQKEKRHVAFLHSISRSVRTLPGPSPDSSLFDVGVCVSVSISSPRTLSHSLALSTGSAGVAEHEHASQPMLMPHNANAASPTIILVPVLVLVPCLNRCITHSLTQRNHRSWNALHPSRTSHSVNPFCLHCLARSLSIAHGRLLAESAGQR